MAVSSRRPSRRSEWRSTMRDGMPRLYAGWLALGGLLHCFLPEALDQTLSLHLLEHRRQARRELGMAAMQVRVQRCGFEHQRLVDHRRTFELARVERALHRGVDIAVVV